MALLWKKDITAPRSKAGPIRHVYREPPCTDAGGCARLRWETEFQRLVRETWQGGAVITASKGNARELRGHAFTLSDARDRCLANSGKHFNAFAAIGRWLWIMSGRMDLESIRYYEPLASKQSVDGVRLHGAYGPRLFGIGVFNQVPELIKRIKSTLASGKPSDSRKAVAAVYVPTFDTFREPTAEAADEVPCTLGVQYFPRGGRLHAATFMRSQDVVKILPIDLFVFTMMQEYVAASVGLEVGDYRLLSGSFHVYEKDKNAVDAILASTEAPLPLMPALSHEQPDLHLKKLLDIEEQLRVITRGHVAEPGRKPFETKRFVKQAKELPDFWGLVVLGLLAHSAFLLKSKGMFEALLPEVPPCWNLYLRRSHSYALSSITLTDFPQGVGSSTEKTQG